MEGKKSFLLYCDLIHNVSELTDEQAGKLFKIILDYVNDKKPEINDQLLRIAFNPVKLQLKRDLQEWKDKCLRNSENGKLGGRPKKSERLSEKPKKANGFLENPLKAKKADKDNDKDNDTVYINTESHNEIFRKLWKSDKWLEQVCMTFKCEKDDLQNHLNVFRQECLTKDELKVDEKDAKTHFINWIKRGNEIPKPQTNGYKKSTLKDNWF